MMVKNMGLDDQRRPTTELRRGVWLERLACLLGESISGVDVTGSHLSAGRRMSWVGLIWKRSSSK